VLLTPVFGDQITVARQAAKHCTQFDLIKAFSPETMILARRQVASGRDTPACRATVRAVERAEKHARDEEIREHGDRAPVSSINAKSPTRARINPT
jgi:hypothetical protein